MDAAVRTFALLLFFIASPSWAGVAMLGGGVTAASGGNMTIDVSADLDDGVILNCTTASAGTLDTNGSSGVAIIGRGNSAGEYDYGYYRFTLSAAIPTGATITTAVLRPTAAGVNGWDLSSDTLVLQAQDVSDPAQVSANTECPLYTGGGAVALTTASVEWTPTAWTTDTQYNSPDIKTIIQELVTDNSGLAQNAHVQMWVVGKSTVGNAEQIYMYDHAHVTGVVMQIYIEWTN